MGFRLYSRLLYNLVPLSLLQRQHCVLPGLSSLFACSAKVQRVFLILTRIIWLWIISIFINIGFCMEIYALFFLHFIVYRKKTKLSVPLNNRWTLGDRIVRRGSSKERDMKRQTRPDKNRQRKWQADREGRERKRDRAIDKRTRNQSVIPQRTELLRLASDKLLDLNDFLGQESGAPTQRKGPY